MAAVAYYILQRSILRVEGPGSVLTQSIGKDTKGKISPVLFTAAIPLAFVSPWIAGGLYVFVAVMWLIPDRRIECTLVTMERNTEG